MILRGSGFPSQLVTVVYTCTVGLIDPVHSSCLQYSGSTKITKPLVDILLSDNSCLPTEILNKMYDIKKTCLRTRDSEFKSLAMSVKSQLPPDRVRLFEISSQRGAFVWLSALPLKEYGFAFRDAVGLRYDWKPPELPSFCVCGNSFSIDHSLSCPYEGFMTLCHNDVRDLTASLLKNVCPNVCVADVTCTGSILPRIAYN